jgi:CRP-like cAMP-binding protein
VGLLGIPAVLGHEQSVLRVVTQVPGQCVRVPSARFRLVLSECGNLEELVRKYLGFSWHMANQNLACGLRHPVRQRICRWLLALHDQADENEFSLTHELLAQMVNASRQKVTTTAGRLQSEGLIRYNRGRVRILSRPGLEAAGCECYRVLRNNHEQLFD